LDRGHAAALAAVVQLDPQQLAQQCFAFRPFPSAEEVLQTRSLPGLPGGLEARADLINPFGHAQRERIPPLRSLRSHAALPLGALTDDLAPHGITPRPRLEPLTSVVPSPSVSGSGPASAPRSSAPGHHAGRPAAAGTLPPPERRRPGQVPARSTQGSRTRPRL